MNFFYDLNKKLNSIGAVPESTQLNERDLGKQLNELSPALLTKARDIAQAKGSNAADNNQFVAARIHNAQGDRLQAGLSDKLRQQSKAAALASLSPAKRRLAGLDEGHCPTCNCSPCTCNEGNAFSGAVVKAKADGIQPGEKVKVGGKTYPVKEQGMMEAVPNSDMDFDRRATTDYALKMKQALEDKTSARVALFYDKDNSITLVLNPQSSGPDAIGFLPDGDYGATLKNMSSVIDPYYRMFREKGWMFQQPLQGRITFGVPAEGRLAESKGKKPDFLDLDKDGNKKESMKKAAADKKKNPFKKNMSEDQLDELSPATIDSYRSKAIGQASWAGGVAKALGAQRKSARPEDPKYKNSTWTDPDADYGSEGDKYAKLNQKRGAGIQAANKRGATAPAQPYDWSRQGGHGDKTNPAIKSMSEDSERKTTHGTERTKGNITTHTRNYEPDVEDDDDFNAEPRKAGRPKGTKHATGAKGPTGKSKLLQLKAIREEGDTCPHCGAKKVVDERSVSQAQAHMMAGAAHNPKFAKKVGVKSSVAKEFNKADTGKDIGKLPKKVKEADVAPAAEKAPSNKYGFGKGIYDSLNRQVDNLITEGMSVTVNMSTDDTGQPHKDITVHADGDDAAKLAELLNLAGIQQSNQSCSSCGQSPCGCGDQMVDENSPSNAPDTVFASVDQVVGPQYGGGPNAPHQMINPADSTFNPPGDMAQDTINAGPGARRLPATTNENKQADLGMSLYKELQQFKGK